MSQLKHLVSFMKFFGAVLFLLIALALVWFVGLSYSGHHAEVAVKQIFSTTGVVHSTNAENPFSNSFYFELLNYDRGLVRSSAQLRLRSNDSSIDKTLEDLVFEMGIKHGPIIISSGYFHFQTALIQVGVSGKADVLNLQMLLGFDNLLQYTINLDDLNYQEGNFNFISTKGVGTGVINLAESEKESQFTLDIEQINFSLAGQSVATFNNKLVYHLGNSLTMQSKAKSHGKENAILLQDLQVPVLMEHILAYQQWADIQQQIAWTLEFSGDLQEGRDRLIALYVHSDELQTKKGNDGLSQCFDKSSLKTVAMRKRLTSK